MTTFTELGLNPILLKSLEAEGYVTPTPIQSQAIPSVLAGRDLLGIAQTGTGKTAAFALPILHRLVADPRPAPRRGARVLVLSPTRELASQIAASFKTYGRNLGLTVITVFGGVAHRPQAQALARGVDVLVATPGRLLDHMGERNLTLDTTEILVLDEADQMMDLGFIKPLRQIVAKLPARRQSLFFSATMPQEIGGLAADLLRDPVKVAVTPVAKTADRVEQKVIFVESHMKRAALVQLFADPKMSRTLVFTRTKRGADKVARHLGANGILSAAIHGNKSQGQREQALAAFKAGRIRGLVATDIAARGIDVDEVSHVINFEMPNIPESYVHRIGRTARAGAEGIAISLVDGEERAYLRDIERLTRQQIPSQDMRGDSALHKAAGLQVQSTERSSPDEDGRGRNRRPDRPHRQPHRQDDRRGNGSGHRDPRRAAAGSGSDGDRNSRPANGQRFNSNEHESHSARQPRTDAARPQPASSQRPVGPRIESRDTDLSNVRFLHQSREVRGAGPARTPGEKRDGGANFERGRTRRKSH